MEALNEISRRAIGAVAMLGVGEVPKLLMRGVHECVTNGSERNESNVLFFRVVKEELMNWSSLLREEGERGLFRLHPLIKQYVKFDAGRTGQVWQDVALRAVHGSVLQEEVEQPATMIYRCR